MGIILLFIFLTLGLLLVGGLATLATIVNPRHPRSVPFWGFTSLCGVIGAVSLAISCASFSYRIFHLEALSFLVAIGGYIVGGLAGADLGYRGARRYDANVKPRRLARSYYPRF